MAFVPINFVGSLGIVRDLEPHLLPPNAWTEGENVRMNNGYAHKIPGERRVYFTDDPPYELFYVPDPNRRWWIYCGLNNVWGIDQNGTQVQIGSGFNATDDVGWSGGILSGVPVINNSYDLPQMWTPVTAGQQLQTLQGWDVNWTCKILRPFGNFLVALDITKSGERFPYMVKWSHPADPGSVPASWDESDTTKDAGEFDLGDTPDYLVDGLSMRNTFIIYKERTAYRMQYIGGQFIFRFDNISKLDGMFTRRCAVEFRPGFHAVLTHNDFMVHNGVEAESVIDGFNRKWLFDAIEPDEYTKVFLVLNERHNEVWICFPEFGETLCTKALIWNYREKTWGDRELPNVATIKHGVVSEALVDTWDGGL